MADVAVIGVPNDEFGEEVKAVVEVSTGVEATDELAKRAPRHGAARSWPDTSGPRSVDFVAEMPRTGTGKILKRELRGPYWAGTGRSI